MSERSSAPQGPRHLAEGSVPPPWWKAVDPRRVVVAGLLSFAALPVLVVDNLSTEASSAEAVETAVPESTTTTRPTTTTSSTSTTAAPTTTAPPTTAPPTTAPPTTAAATTAPPTTAARRTTTTAPPTTAAPTTTAPPPPPAGSVEEVIRSWFGAAGDQAVAVARCESGLNPSARSAAGYRGLFQLSPSHASAFAAVTGRDFEDAWDEAGPNSQFARYLYDRDGWSPWGACAP